MMECFVRYHPPAAIPTIVAVLFGLVLTGPLWSQYRETKGFLDVAGTSVHYRQIRHEARDHGRLVVFFHGGPGSNSVVFRHAVGRRIADRIGTLLLIDQRGCGSGSSQGIDPKSYNFETFVEDMHAVIIHILRQNDWRHAPILIGHSFGASLAVAYADKYPKVFDEIVLVAPVLNRHDARRWALKEIERRARKIDDRKTIEHIRGLTLHTQPEQDWTADFLDIVSNPAYQITERKFASDLEAHLHGILSQRSNETIRPEIAAHFTRNTTWRHLDQMEHFLRLEPRSLLIGGEQDFLAPPESLQLLAGMKPDTRLVLMPGSGHYPFLLNPGGFVETVETFLTSKMTAAARTKLPGPAGIFHLKNDLSGYFPE